MPSKIDALASLLTPMDESIAYAKVMIYGGSGVGKTVMAVKLAQEVTNSDQQIIYLDAVEGFVSLRNHPELMKRTQRMQYMGLSQFETLGTAFKSATAPFDNVGCLIIDEISSVQKFDMDTVVKVRRSKGSLDEDEEGDWPTYNQNLQRVRREMMGLLKLPLNVVLVSHEKRNGDKTIVPSMPPALTEAIKELMHVVARMESTPRNQAGNISYVRSVQNHPTISVTAKSRIGGLALKTTSEDFIKVVGDFVRSGGPILDETEVVEDDINVNIDEFLGIDTGE